MLCVWCCMASVLRMLCKAEPACLRAFKQRVAVACQCTPFCTRGDWCNACGQGIEGCTLALPRSGRHHGGHSCGGLPEGAAHFCARDGVRGADRHSLSHGAGLALLVLPSDIWRLSLHIGGNIRIDFKNPCSVRAFLSLLVRTVLVVTPRASDWSRIALKADRFVQQHSNRLLAALFAAYGAGVACVLRAPAPPGQHSRAHRLRVRRRGPNRLLALCAVSGFGQYSGGSFLGTAFIR